MISTPHTHSYSPKFILFFLNLFNFICSNTNHTIIFHITLSCSSQIFTFSFIPFLYFFLLYPFVNLSASFVNSIFCVLVQLCIILVEFLHQFLTELPEFHQFLSPYHSLAGNVLRTPCLMKIVCPIFIVGCFSSSFNLFTCVRFYFAYISSKYSIMAPQNRQNQTASVNLFRTHKCFMTHSLCWLILALS